jgi:hypothetical protein
MKHDPELQKEINELEKFSVFRFLHGYDPQTGKVELFIKGRDNWAVHFRSWNNIVDAINGIKSMVSIAQQHNKNNDSRQSPIDNEIRMVID